jgi:4-amino-4-deoxy-L-arabinose transferase-like glycosyltransferase
VKKSAKYYILIIVIGALFFLPFLGEVHLFDWDEINFAEAAREMLVTGNWLSVKIDYEPFHEKPPLFIWFQAISMSVLGVSEFAARLPNALMGIFTLMILFRIGKKIFDENFGLIWSLVYLGSFLPHFYFKSAIIDPYFNFFMFTSMYYLYRSAHETIHRKDIISYKNIILAGILNSLAVMTKGPVGFLLVFVAWAVFWIMNRKEYIFPLVHIIIFTALAFLPVIIWYMVVFMQIEGSIISEFIKYQIRLLTTGDAGHSQPLYYHFVILFFGCFPATAFMFNSFKRRKEDEQYQSEFKQWNFILLSVVLIIFTIVKTKIVHYSSLAYFPITFLAAYTIYKQIYFNYKKAVLPFILIGTIGIIYAGLFTAFPLLMKNIDLYLDQVTDKFTKGILLADVTWSHEYFIGIFYALVIIIGLIILYKNYLKGILVLFAGSAIVLFTFLPLLAPKIEQYTQAAPIEFYESLQDEDVYVHVLGYKSYAHYFYAGVKPENSRHTIDLNKKEWEKFLLEGNINKPAYFVTNNKKIKKYAEYEQLEELYRKNGFVFLRRLPEKDAEINSK